MQDTRIVEAVMEISYSQEASLFTLRDHLIERPVVLFHNRFGVSARRKEGKKNVE